MKNLFTILAFLCVFNLSTAQLNVSFVSSVEYNQGMSDVWGYVAPNGTEYALVGLANGVSIINLADPANPVESDFVPGITSGWRDIKTWDEHAYVTNESGNGVAVIDLSTLPDSVSAFDWTPFIPNLGTVTTCHNIFIDSLGFAYLSGCNVNNGGLIFVDVQSVPGTPVYVGHASPAYSHDVYVRDNLAYSSEINQGVFSIYDVSNKAAPFQLASQPTPAATTHNAWLSDDSSIIFTTDETGNAPVASYDISNLGDIKELDQFRPLQTLGSGVTPHNVHVWNDWLIISYYTDGCILVDASRPENMVEVGNFDTFLPASTGFSGAWGAYPFLPSGLILISDIGNGLFVLEPNYVRACWLEGTVRDAITAAPIINAEVDMVGVLPFERTDITGVYKTGIATPGEYDVLVKKFGYEPATATVTLANNMVTIQDFELQPLPSFEFSGQVLDSESGEPVPEAIIQISNDDFETDLNTDANGNFSVSPLFEDVYEIWVGKWGYKTIQITNQDINQVNNFIIIELEPGIEDVFSLDLGWTVEGSASQGLFELGDPVEVTVTTPFGDFTVQPGEDAPGDLGTGCYVTGNTANIQNGVLIGGGTRITSPVFDISEMVEPRLSYYTWYLNVVVDPQNPNPGNDAITVKLTNGMETVVIEEVIFESILFPPQWTPSEINILDTIVATENMQILFEINDTDFMDISEGLVDWFRVWDANPTGIKDFDNQHFALSVSPNPSSGIFHVFYRNEPEGGAARMTVFNALGQTIETIDLNQNEGTLELGSEYEKGMYFVQIRNENRMSRSLKIIKN